MLIHVPSDAPDPDQWGNMRHGREPDQRRVFELDEPRTPVAGGRGGRSRRQPVDPHHAPPRQHDEPERHHGLARIGARAGRQLDILGLSCYVNWHGPPSFWHNTFQTLASRFTDLDFVIAEYGPEARRASEIVRDIPDRRGLGTFVWEPTQSGVWGPSMFSNSGDTYQAQSEAFDIYDGIRADFGLP